MGVSRPSGTSLEPIAKHGATGMRTEHGLFSLIQGCVLARPQAARVLQVLAEALEEIAGGQLRHRHRGFDMRGFNRRAQLQL